MRAAALLFAAMLAAGPAAFAQEPEGEPAQEAPAPDVAALNPLATLDKAVLDGFRDMPLFTPSRQRPAPPEVVEAEAPPPPPPPREAEPEPAPDIKLAGVVEGPEGAVAVVENEGEMERLRLGDQVGGWLVTTIDGASLKLTLDDREQEYRMFQRSGDAASAGEASGEAEDPDADPVVRRPPPGGKPPKPSRPSPPRPVEPDEDPQ